MTVNPGHIFLFLNSATVHFLRINDTDFFRCRALKTVNEATLRLRVIVEAGEVTRDEASKIMADVLDVVEENYVACLTAVEDSASNQPLTIPTILKRNP